MSGAHVLPGYLGGRGDEETKFRVDGQVWHRTGDAGYLDLAGRLWLLGRCQARVDDAAGSVYPFSVECGAMHCAGVARAAFVQHRGARVLLVEPARGCTPPDLSQVAAELAWARLAEIREYPRIPVDRRHNAKVDYTALPRLLAARPSTRPQRPRGLESARTARGLLGWPAWRTTSAGRFISSGTCSSDTPSTS